VDYQCFDTVSWIIRRASGLFVDADNLELCTSYSSSYTSIILSLNKIQNGDILVPTSLLGLSW